MGAAIMGAEAFEGLRWHKSSRSNAGGGAQCVELARLATGTAVRDGKQRGGAVLVFPTRAFRAFLAGVR
ncbi:DUF397 domain-containing protein [Actinosynnema sp. NPDC023587]|uniref:DUF397 domain-containing protein n=1 Tax=Actinosynnema sp. NPDC023587 TaxID=3154695 RepID=UPI0033C96349